ncbi:MAG: S9 family peptidase [Sphingomonadales bacterium]
MPTTETETANTQAPPVAAALPTETTHHGITVTDPYGWLRDPGYPDVTDEKVLAYLEAENAYFKSVMAPHQDLTEKIFEELKARIKEDDSSVPVKDGNYFYHWRFETGAQYRTWLRTPVKGGGETVILSEPERARDHDFYVVRRIAASPDHALLAWSEDFDGSERFVIRVKNVDSSEQLADEIPNTNGVPVWTADSQAFFYVELNENLRPFRVRLHRLGDKATNDVTVYEETDGSFFVGVSRTQSRAYIVINTGDHVTNEVRLVPADQPQAPPLLIAPRLGGHEYYVDHAGDTLFIRTNDRHKNFRVVTARVTSASQENWRELIAASDSHYIRGLTSFADFVMVEERIDGLDQIRVRHHDGREHFVPFPEAAYRAALGDNREADPDTIRISYESMVTPDTVFDYRVPDRALITRKVQEIPSGYDASLYATERLMAPARDGALVPVSIVYRKDFNKDGAGRLHLYGYGAYGFGYPPNFSSSRLSLLDRGFAFAIAHIRGGDELGYHWYEGGKLFERTNTFHDFVDVARYLIDQGIAAPGNISISGGSAGGSLMGYVANSNPELWRAVVAHVPFVDILNTMLDDSLPLTPIEWPEWGNPITGRQAFEYILSYSPYENVTAQDYPAMLVTAGLNDPRVTYWEPAKWVARLRATKTGDDLLLLKTNMGAGHRGKSGRFDSLHEVAEEYVFILKSFGLAEGQNVAGTPAGGSN